MSVATKFKEEIERCLEILDEDEWALTNARDNAVKDLEPHEAFSSIKGVLDLALVQEDDYAFSTCCWLALQLIGKAQTTEIPEGVTEVLNQLYVYSSRFGPQGNEVVNEIASKFRLKIGT